MLKKAFSRTPKHLPHLGSKIRALDIPEILERIFSLLDDLTLHQNVILVCRQWYILNRGKLLRKVTWDSSWPHSKLDAVASRLVGAPRLDCYVQTDYNLDTHSTDIGKVLVQSQREYRRRTEMLTTTRTTGLYKSSPLLELYLRIEALYTPVTFTNFPFPETLTKLVLVVQNSSHIPAEVNLAIILEKCLELEYFELDGNADFDLTWKSVTTADHRQQQHQKQQEQKVLSLRSFILNNTWLKQDSLESLLVMTPRLKVLKLIAMSSKVITMNPGGGPKRYDELQLLSRILSLSIALDTFHLSCGDREYRTPPQVMQQILDKSPSTMSEWHLWTFDISPSLLTQLHLHTNRLTTLELHAPPDGSLCSRQNCCMADIKNTLAPLHYFLTTSDDAVHLRTLKTVARLEDFDLYCRGRYYQLDDATNALYSADICAPEENLPVWRCRRLQTLYLEMHGPGEYLIKEPIHSRIIFGYISRVFPMLEELQIDTPVQCYSNPKKVSYTPKLTIRLEGGLCLLGRLRYLQRLRVHANGLPLEPAPFGEEELNWMVSSGQESSKFRKKRQERAQLWQQQRFREEQLDALRLKKKQDHGQKGEEAVVVSRLSGTNGSLDAEALLMDQLKSLGMLNEVDEMIRDIGLRSLLPLPCLEGLSLVHPYFVCPEDEIRHCVTPRINKSRSTFGLWS